MQYILQSDITVNIKEYLRTNSCLSFTANVSSCQRLFTSQKQKPVNVFKISGIFFSIGDSTEKDRKL